MSTKHIYQNPITSAHLWHVIDATNHHVGSLATKIAGLLRGKHKPIYDRSSPLECGDYVVVLNSRNIQLTGKKWDQKLYRRHTGYPGGLRETPASQMLEKDPNHILRHAVLGMLPKNDSKYYLEQRLKIYENEKNPHIGQISKTPQSSLALNLGPYEAPTINPTNEQVDNYFAGYILKMDDNVEQFSMVESKVRDHKDNLKRQRRVLRKKRANELKPINIEEDN
ncbi:hypothetical protein CYY_008258 [Polysphondylium violaceum]|uniref:50S ribosomal protein L13 n=1 Tax=Polysphondylium violaceum TaxID=133409 RepID=A0A8J4PNN3_9MYCE|nr:hypothetical protein CYY_008258 [Polysphondylium violaceum]